jgi:hypothetical protein
LQREPRDHFQRRASLRAPLGVELFRRMAKLHDLLGKFRGMARSFSAQAWTRGCSRSNG